MVGYAVVVVPLVGWMDGLVDRSIDRSSHLTLSRSNSAKAAGSRVSSCASSGAARSSTSPNGRASKSATAAMGSSSSSE